MTEVESIRAKLTEADRLRAVKRAAETARVSIRLGQQPVARRGLIGFLRRTPNDRDTFFTKDETAAIYQALAQIRDDCGRRADQIEREVAR